MADQVKNQSVIFSFSRKEFRPFRRASKTEFFYFSNGEKYVYETFDFVNQFFPKSGPRPVIFKIVYKTMDFATSCK